MQSIKKVITVWKNVFSNFHYFSLTIAAALAFYGLNVLISNITTLVYQIKNESLLSALKLFGLFLVSFHETILPSSVAVLWIMSILTGILITFLVFNLKQICYTSEKKMGFFASIAILLGLLVPGCAACGIGLAGILGVGASLTFLPLQGLEISLIAILLLSFSIVKISLNLAKPITCPIPYSKSERRYIK